MRRLIAKGLIGTILIGLACSANGADCAPAAAIEAYESGKAHLQSGRLDKGISDIERAVAIYPDFGDAWYDLYESYRRAGRNDDAITALEELVRIHPGRHSGAEIWRELLTRHRAEAEIPSAAGRALNKCRRLKAGSKRAIRACEKASRLHTGYVDAHYFLGVNHIHAGDEESAKEQLAALIALDPMMAGMLAHVMDELTDWMTEEYKQELQIMFAATEIEPSPDTPAEALPAEFSDQEIARILRVYERQIDALQELIADPELRPEECRLEAPTEMSNRLRKKLIPLSITRIERSHNPDCQHGLMYLMLDVRDPADRRYGLSEVVKIAKNLEVGDPVRERWRIGLDQEWAAQQYCKAECTARFQIRIDRETDGEVVRFRAWVEVLREIADIARCGSHYGEMPGAEEW